METCPPSHKWLRSVCHHHVSYFFGSHLAHYHPAAAAHANLSLSQLSSFLGACHASKWNQCTDTFEIVSNLKKHKKAKHKTSAMTLPLSSHTSGSHFYYNHIQSFTGCKPKTPKRQDESNCHQVSCFIPADSCGSHETHYHHPQLPSSQPSECQSRSPFSLPQTSYRSPPHL